MKSGLFLILPRPAGRPLTGVVGAAVDDAVLAESLGFDRVWLTEHHGTDFGSCASPSVLAAAIAARTTRVGIGYAVNVSPFHAPRRLAEDVALVDHLSGGRVVAGFGAGYSPVEYGVVGVPFHSRQTEARRVMDAVLGLWSRQSEGRVECCQQPHPPVVVACRTEAAIRAVAGAGHGVLLLGELERIERGARAYREARGGGGYVGALRHVLVHDDGDAVEDEAAAAASWTVQRMQQLAGQEPPDAGAAARYLQGRLTAGPADRVRVDLERLRHAGVDELLCWMRWGDLSDGRVRDTMERYASQVLGVI